MASVIKIAGPQFTVNSTPNTVPSNAGAGSTLLYLLNNNASVSNVTVTNNSSNTGTITMLPNTVLFIEKYTNDTIQASANLLATPIVFVY